MMVPAALHLDDATAAALREFESHLDPAQPEAGGEARVIGYGEISAALILQALPGLVCKRMTGFADMREVAQYATAVRDYLSELGAQGVRIADTRLAVVSGKGGRPVVYLVQPLLDPRGIAANILRGDSDERLLACLASVLDTVWNLLKANTLRSDGRIVAVDAQLSNWWFAPDSAEAPTLIDVGTPFMRRDGRDECGTNFFLAPVPAPLRWYYRRQRAVENYIDDYFDPRAVVLDVLGNFHKEGVPHRISLALPLANQWLAKISGNTPTETISTKNVQDYYQKDAADLELYLRLRRADRWVKNKLLCQQYPFILPGPIQR